MGSSPKELLLAAASREGFDLCRVARIGRAPHFDALDRWLAAGHHATMDWMARTRDARTDPQTLLAGARSVIVLATNYLSHDAPTDGTRGRVARYARGGDYHEILMPRLHAVSHALSAFGGEQKPFVDGGPVLERDWAAECGISWHGKSTMGIHPQLGTWFFLSVILTTLDLPADAPLPDRCGRCTRCIAACPTGAIIAPHQLDARRCISFLTIENKGPIPLHLRRAMGDRIFGCDDCLDACPWNRFARLSREAAFHPDPILSHTPLRDFLSMDDSSFRNTFRQSPIRRAKRRGFLRNVCVALGNTGDARDLPALEHALHDTEPLIREHAAWAIAEIEARGVPAA